MAQCTAFREMKRPNRIVCAQLTIYNSLIHTPSTSDYSEMKYAEKEDENSAQFNLAAHTARWQLAFGAQMETIQRETPSTTTRKKQQQQQREENPTAERKSKWNEDQRQKCEQKCVSLGSIKLCALDWMIMDWEIVFVVASSTQGFQLCVFVTTFYPKHSSHAYF